jgi:hypothetical protein
MIEMLVAMMQLYSGRIVRYVASAVTAFALDIGNTVPSTQPWRRPQFVGT